VSIREWIAASDPSALGFLGGMLFMAALAILIGAIHK
jgi:hypothetical protein